MIQIEAKLCCEESGCTQSVPTVVGVSVTGGWLPPAQSPAGWSKDARFCKTHNKDRPQGSNPLHSAGGHTFG